MMKQSCFHHLLFFFMCMVIGVTGNSQVNRPVSWIKNYGGTKIDNPISVKSTPDGGTVFCGVTNSNDYDVSGLHGTENDIWVVKVDRNGVIQWQKTYLTNVAENPKDLIVTSDGGYAVCSWILVGSINHTLILKLSNNGTVEWQKQLNSDNALVSRITETADGGFAFTGYMNGPPTGEFVGQPAHGVPSDLFIAKVNNAGTFLWGKTYGGSQGEIGSMIRQLSDGSLLVGAQTYSNDGDVTGSHNSPVSNGDFWILKLAADGNAIWKKCFGGSGNELARDGFEKDGRYYLTGTTNNSSAAPSGDVTAPIDGNDIWFVVLDTAGTLVRQKCIGGSGNGDVALSIAPTLDGKIILGGNSNSNDNYVSGNHGQADYALIKIDTLGNKVSGKLFGNSANEFGGVQFGARAVVNTDTSFSLLAGSQVGGGEIPALYGSDDILMIRYIDTSLYQDLYANINYSTNVFSGRPINYKLIFGKNNSVVSADTVVLQFVMDTSLQLVSTTRPPSIIAGDTLTWKIPKAAILRTDTISLSFQPDPALTSLPDSIRAMSFITPWNMEYYQTNNVAYAASKLKNQNASIINPDIDINSNSFYFFNANKPTGYNIIYKFQNQLDTLTGIVRLVKDHRMQFVSATVPYDSIAGDTMVWNFSVTPGSYNRTISFQLRADTPVVHMGDTLRHFVTLQFNTQDISVVTRKDSIKQVINQICSPVSTVNTTLPYPQGVQWMRAVGGSAYDEGRDIIAMSDSTFITVALTSSTDGDAAPGAPYENGLVTKYSTGGNIVWQKLLGGNGTDRFWSAVKAVDQSVIVAGHSSSSNGIFSSNHGSVDAWLTKLDSNGNTVWNKLLGGTDWDGRLIFIRKFRDNRYVVVTTTQSFNGNVNNPYTTYGEEYPWLFMIDESGTMLWQKVLHDTLFNYIADVVVTLKKEILIIGQSYSTYHNGARLLRTDSLGNIKQLKNYAKAGRSLWFWSGVVNADSTFVLAGESQWAQPDDQYCYGDHPDTEAWLAKLDKNLNILWEKYYGGDHNDFAYDIIKAADGGYFVCGATLSTNGNVSGNHDASGNTSDAWLLKIDNNGQLVWQKTIGGDKNDRANEMIQLNNNAIIIAGQTLSYNNGDIYGSKGGSDAIVFKIGVTNAITGMVYMDSNGNHVKESNEPFVQTGIVKSVKGNFTNSSDINNGYFATAVDTGIYVTAPVMSSPYFQSFPATHSSSFTGYANTDTINFALVPVSVVNDIKITVLPITAARPGFDVRYTIKYENTGTTTIPSGNITIIKDPRTSFVSATVPYNSIIADTIKWNFSNFDPFETTEFVLTLKAAMPPLLMNGDTLHIKGIVNPVAGDSTIGNNTSEVNQLVTGSYDPNDKTETHGPGFTAQSLAQGERLNYIIRFQNTGSDTAFRVLVRDTLDQKLDWNSLQMISASHDYHLTINNGNLLEWKFDPIILPDSTHNEAASHGFIAFSIRPRNDLAIGDTIANRAGIYFDFNLPVLTNIQHTIIDKGVNSCPGASKAYWSGIPGALAYRWQMNDGTGYVDLVNNSLYSGVASDTLRIITPPTSISGNKYRCIVTTANGNAASVEYEFKVGVKWTGAVSTAWEDAGNWDCGVLPDANTDVLIQTGTVIVNSNREVRSLTMKPGVEFWVNVGAVFSVLH